MEDVLEVLPIRASLLLFWIRVSQCQDFRDHHHRIPAPLGYFLSQERRQISELRKLKGTCCCLVVEEVEMLLVVSVVVELRVCVLHFYR